MYLYFVQVHDKGTRNLKLLFKCIAKIIGLDQQQLAGQPIFYWVRKKCLVKYCVVNFFEHQNCTWSGPALEKNNCRRLVCCTRVHIIKDMMELFSNYIDKVVPISDGVFKKFQRFWQLNGGFVHVLGNI